MTKATKEAVPQAKVYVHRERCQREGHEMSDVDMLICVLKEYKSREVKKEIVFKTIDEHGVPWDYPFEAHFHDYET